MAMTANWSMQRSCNNIRSRGAENTRPRRNFSWKYRWFPNGVPTRIHFGLPTEMYDNNGSKDPWKIGYGHYVKMARSGRGGSVECGDNCVVCACTDPQRFGLTNVEINNSLAKSYRDLYIGVSGWIEEWFHIVQETKDGKTYSNSVQCEKRACEMCRKNIPKVFGRRFYTQFSYPVWKAVFEPFQERVERFCKCGGRLAVFDFRCSKCSEMIMDFINNCGSCNSTNVNVLLDDGIAQCGDCHVEWSLFASQDPELAKFVSSPVNCPHCGTNDFPVTNLSCALQGEKCNNQPDPFNIFDTSIVLVKNDKRTEIASWKIAEPDPRLFDVKFQGDGEVAETNAKRNAEPLDLVDLLTPMSTADQAKYIGVPDPWGGSPGQNTAKSYQKTESYDSDE